MTMCNNCTHKIVCGKFRATGGVRECEHHEEERRGKWEKAYIPGHLRCSCCKDAFICADWLVSGKWNVCPNCGADMRGKKDG